MNNTLTLREKLIIAYFVDKMTKRVMLFAAPLSFTFLVIFSKIIQDFSLPNFVLYFLSSIGFSIIIARIIAINIIDVKITNLSKKEVSRIYHEKKETHNRLLETRKNLQKILSDKGEDLEFNSSRRKLQKVKNRICRVEFEMNLFDNKTE